MEESDDQVIDLAAYMLRKRLEEAEEDESAERSVFTFWGGDGERSRFALPLWRAAYLGRGLRAALVSQTTGAALDKPEALVVLDLREEVVRLDFAPAVLGGAASAEKPGTLASGEQGTAIYLGEENGRRWYLAVDDFDVAEEPGEFDEERPRRVEGDLLFLAGECAGLLFFRGLAESTGEEDES